MMRISYDWSAPVWSPPVSHAGVVPLERLLGGLLVSEDTVTLPTWSSVAVLADEDPLLCHWQFWETRMVNRSWTGGADPSAQKWEFIFTIKESDNLSRPCLERKPPHLDYCIRLRLLFFGRILQEFVPPHKQLTNSSYSAILPSLGFLSTFLVSIQDISLYRASKTSRYRLPMWALWNLWASFWSLSDKMSPKYLVWMISYHILETSQHHVGITTGPAIPERTSQDRIISKTRKSIKMAIITAPSWKLVKIWQKMGT